MKKLWGRGGVKLQILTMKHGLAMEPHVKRKLIEIFKLDHKKVTASESGIVVLCD